MTTKKPIFIIAEWDEEANMWVATSDDIPGLVTEAETIENLVEKLKIIVPELLEANGITYEKELSLEILSRRFELIHVDNERL